MFFQYGNKEIEFLKAKDKRLAFAIEKIGHVEREVDSDLFSAVVHQIIAQQISTKAQATIWKRLNDLLKMVNAKNISDLSPKKLQSFGMTFKKAEYILDFAKKVNDGIFDLEKINEKSDEEVVKELSSLKGVGVWTAEMIMTFCMQRSNIVSFGDLAILRGMRMLYRHRKIDKVKFEKYRKRYSPYGTVASLYLWAIAGGAIPELTDPAEKLKTEKVK